jgi:hypothetical protein
LPGCAVSLSSEVAPELKEYERTSTTVANAYVQPLVRRYLATLEAGLQGMGDRGAPAHYAVQRGELLGRHGQPVPGSFGGVRPVWGRTGRGRMGETGGSRSGFRVRYGRYDGKVDSVRRW